MTEAKNEILEREGVDHINIDIRSKVELGRMLSIASDGMFEHPEHGVFLSMNGFWHWMRSGMIHDDLKGLSAKEARHVGKDKPFIYHEDFTTNVVEALYYRTKQTVRIRREIVESTLPFDQYYIQARVLHPDLDGIVVRPDSSAWISYGYEHIRKLLIADKPFDKSTFRSELIAKGITKQ